MLFPMHVATGPLWLSATLQPSGPQLLQIQGIILTLSCAQQACWCKAVNLLHSEAATTVATYIAVNASR
jgi:hypothetical protein